MSVQFSQIMPCDTMDWKQ